MLKSLKNLFRPESSVVKKQVSTLGVVFNSVNHTSLLAAVFTAIILEQKAKIKVFLIDVRDAFQEADMYLWLDAGDITKSKDYLLFKSKDGATRESYRPRIQIIESSIFLGRRPGAAPISADETVLGRACDFIQENYGMIADEDRTLFYRWAMVGERWNTEIGRSFTNEAAAYSHLLQCCYLFYCGNELTYDNIRQHPFEVSNEEGQIYVQEQKIFGKAMVRRCRYVFVDGVGFHYLNTTGPEVYGLIRRISIANQNFIHVTEGSYGTVSYGSIPLPKKQTGEKSNLDLTPISTKVH